MKNKIMICSKCKATNLKTLVPRLKELNLEIKEGCFNFCGIGINKSICVLNDIPITADSEDDLIDEIKAKIK